MIKAFGFRPLHCGVYPIRTNDGSSQDALAFAFDAGALFGSGKELGVVIYDSEGITHRFPFSMDSSSRSGDVLGLYLTGINKQTVEYNFYAGESIILDKCALAYKGNNEFGVLKDTCDIRSVYSYQEFDWQGDSNPSIPFEDSILYGLNVRSFTKDSSSKIKHKGTYQGIVEKLPYLKELGVTSLVLMPAYEFDECENLRIDSKKPQSMEEAQKSVAKPKGLLNCWGFTEGRYFAPKSAYSASKDSITEFKTMVRELHKERLEVIMQFYFPPTMSEAFIVEILRFWAVNYHIDGFRICGFNIPQRALMLDPVLKGTKLWFNYVGEDEIQLLEEKPYRRICSENGNFRNDLRRFLKGDEGMLNAFIAYQKAYNPKIALINYISDYDGFSLNDLYTYEHKHNEANLEDNRDGTDMNLGWNCGVEGPTRRKQINQSRIKQIKNALALLMISLGTPYIFAGDEFGNTRLGNNNSYCIDDETAYVKWSSTVKSREILDFAKAMIKLRRENRIFHRNEYFKNIDTRGLGYPDLSYHGIEAWKADTGYTSRMLGMYFCGDYGFEDTKGCDSKSYYVGINMHWENHRLAVPKLKGGRKYHKLIDTGLYNGASRDNEIPVFERSVVIYSIE